MFVTNRSKLTALPDNSTCQVGEDYYGCEIVIRPDTIVYLACSVVANFKDNQKGLADIIGKNFDTIEDWTDGNSVWLYIPEMISAIDKVSEHFMSFDKALKDYFDIEKQRNCR